jgi:SAM-dependent methyltransferase
MGRVARYSDYDRFAWIYNRYWGADFVQRALPVLDQLLLSELPAGARVLDVGCGTGQLAQALAARGYAVTGLDGSEEMLRFARENAPEAEFILGDARDFSVPPVYHAALSTYDSLNHLLSLEELTAAFRCVHRGLLSGGLFVFDLNMGEGYQARWRGSFGLVADDHACIVRSRYQPDQRLGRMDFTLFVLEDGWRRSDFALTQRCYTEAEVRAALEAAGFAEVRAHDAQPCLSGEIGRMFFVGRRQ